MILKSYNDAFRDNTSRKCSNLHTIQNGTQVINIIYTLHFTPDFPVFKPVQVAVGLSQYYGLIKQIKIYFVFICFTPSIGCLFIKEKYPFSRFSLLL